MRFIKRILATRGKLRDHQRIRITQRVSGIHGVVGSCQRACFTGGATAGSFASIEKRGLSESEAEFYFRLFGCSRVASWPVLPKDSSTNTTVDFFKGPRYTYSDCVSISAIFLCPVNATTARFLLKEPGFKRAWRLSSQRNPPTVSRQNSLVDERDDDKGRKRELTNHGATVTGK